MKANLYFDNDTQKYFFQGRSFTKEFVVINGLEELFNSIVSNKLQVGKIYKALTSKTFQGMKKPLIEEGKEYLVTSIEPYHNTIAIGIKTAKGARLFLESKFYQIFEVND